DGPLITEDGGTGDGCSESAKLIYVVDLDKRLSSFDPTTLKFTDIGTLSCSAGIGATPFSMAVDRSATAWILYSSGQIFKVNTANATCVTTQFPPHQTGFDQFGMGFVSDSAGSTDETLFVGSYTS